MKPDCFLHPYFRQRLLSAIHHLLDPRYRSSSLAAEASLHSLVNGGVSILSCIMVWAAVRLLKTSSPPIKVIKVSNRSGELINYSILTW